MLPTKAVPLEQAVSVPLVAVGGCQVGTPVGVGGGDTAEVLKTREGEDADVDRRGRGDPVGRLEGDRLTSGEAAVVD
jgi:hypothetical protein